MYIISKIEAKNFMCYKELSLDLTNAQNIIIKSSNIENSNGFGKSTIIEIPCWTLYDKLLRGGGGKVNLEDVVSIGEKEVFTAIELTDNVKNNIVRIERFRSEKNKAVKMFINGVEREFDKKTDLNLFISNWLGLDYDGFTRRVLSPENISFLNLTSSERFYSIANLINFNWDKVWNNVQNKIKTCKNELDMIEAETSSLQLTIIKEEGDLKLYKNQVEMLQEQKIVLEEKRDRARNEYAKIKEEVDKCEIEITNLNNIINSFNITETTINEELSSINKKIANLLAYENFQKQRDCIEEANKSLTVKFDKLVKKEKELKTAIDKAEKMVFEKQKENDKALKLVNDAQDVVDNYKVMLMTLQAQEKEFKKYSTLSFSCPHCKKNINGDNIIESLREVSKREYSEQQLKDMLAEAEVKKEKALENKTKINDECIKESNKVVELSGELNSIEKEMTNIMQEQKRNESLLKDLPEKPEYTEKELRALEKEQQDKLTLLKEQKDKKQKELDKIKEVMWSYKTTLNTITIEGKELNKTITDIINKINQIPEISKIESELENKKVKYNDLKKKAEDIHNYYDAYTIIKQGVQPSSEARLNAISRLLPYISDGISKLMSGLLQEKIDIRFDFSDKKLDIICDNYNLRTLSTGQRRCFDIAIATTIQEIAQRTSKNQIGFFIADELFDGLDQNRLYLVMSLLQNLKIPEMFIISHRLEAQELLKTLPNVSNILVNRNGNVSFAKIEKEE
jgi:DNA repair exonuclease SbcCD ATPase subunit